MNQTLERTLKLEHQTLKVLLVEDDLDCTQFVVKAVEMGNLPFHIYPVVGGIEAMDFLRNRDGFKDSPRPDLILLDINLPRKTGRDVLREVKDDLGLKTIPVVLLTTIARFDLQKEFGLVRNCCHTKPGFLKDYVEVLKEIEGDFREGRLS